MQFDDGTKMYNQIYEIFDVTVAQPRRFICHDLAPYHKPEPNSPDQVFRYVDFLGYLGVLQTLPLDSLKLLEKPLWWAKWHWIPQDSSPLLSCPATSVMMMMLWLCKMTAIVLRGSYTKFALPGQVCSCLHCSDEFNASRVPNESWLKSLCQLKSHCAVKANQCLANLYRFIKLTIL